MKFSVGPRALPRFLHHATRRFPLPVHRGHEHVVGRRRGEVGAGENCAQWPGTIVARSIKACDLRALVHFKLGAIAEITTPRADDSRGTDAVICRSIHDESNGKPRARGWRLSL
jgi:hypothetical protein